MIFLVLPDCCISSLFAWSRKMMQRNKLDVGVSARHIDLICKSVWMDGKILQNKNKMIMAVKSTQLPVFPEIRVTTQCFTLEIDIIA